MPRTIKGYGWRPDIPDHRDFRFTRLTDVVLPANVDLRSGMPPVYDQGELGSCTGNAIAAAVEFERLKQGLSDFIPSRLFIYYEERKIEGTINDDSGAEIRDGFKVISSLGVPSETDWAYDISKFAQQPPQQAYDDALKDVAVQYERVNQDAASLKGCLAAGYPFVFGFSVYESFESTTVAATGDAPMPSNTEDQIGGHAVVAVGYDDSTQRWLVRNSWGTNWGKYGYFTLPYGYLLDSDLSDDFWVVKLLNS